MLSASSSINGEPSSAPPRTSCNRNGNMT
jgi:hypothetical protein